MPVKHIDPKRHSFSLKKTKIEQEAQRNRADVACSRLQEYPFDIPTEAFTFQIFKQAFAAVQASVVHLQVTLRFSAVSTGYACPNSLQSQWSLSSEPDPFSSSKILKICKKQ